ncbi:MAG TPA: class I SAM-dependent RNA methyltransferase [Bacteroidetes bacterium]|nr:class I SAM-dependent RNA methyltransferase [Bacteroidota bacterium]
MDPLYNITDLSSDGRGVTRNAVGQVAFITGAIPGDRVTAVFGRAVHKGPIPGRVKEIVHPSPDRIDHPCPHYAEGCPASPLGAMRYEAELIWKRKRIIETLRRIGRISNPPVTDPLPSPKSWGYRGRVELQLVWKDDKWRLAYYGPDGPVAVGNCPLAVEAVQKALKSLNNGLDQILTPARFQLDNLGGLIREMRLMVRDNGRGEAIAQLFLVSPSEQITEYQPLVQWLNGGDLAGWRISRTPQMDTRMILSTVIAEAGNPKVLFELGESSLEVEPTVFTQVNRFLTQSLIEITLETIPRRSRVLDLYGGFGMFALAHAMRGGRAMVVESSREALDAGSEFMSRNHLAVNYVYQDLDHRRFRYQDMKLFDALIVDPPRSGISSGIRRQMNAAAPRRIVYVSCHPAAMARDIAALSTYTIVSINPVDMFPNTPEIETVVVLERLF